MSQEPQQDQQQQHQQRRPYHNNARPKTAPSKQMNSQQGWGNKNQQQQQPNKQFKQKGNKPNGKKPNQPSKTVFIGKVFLDDLEENQNETMARHLKEQRIRLLKDVLVKFGEVERFDHNEAENGVYATFGTKEQALNALDTLKNGGKAEEILNQIKANLAHQKIPAALCPNLLKYRYLLYRPRDNAGNAKNAFNKQAIASQHTVKNVIATPKDQQPQPAAVTAVAAPQPQLPVVQQEVAHHEKKRRGDRKQKTVPVVAQQQLAAPVQITPAQTEQQRRQATEDLMREAEIAKLKGELQFFNKQQTAVRSELDAERERVKDRDARISGLAKELERVNNEKHRIESQLNAEQTWKNKGQESISKLEDEFSHLQEQAQTVEIRLQQLSSAVSMLNGF